MSPETQYIVETITKRIDRLEDRFEKRVEMLEEQQKEIKGGMAKIKLKIAIIAATVGSAATVSSTKVLAFIKEII